MVRPLPLRLRMITHQTESFVRAYPDLGREWNVALLSVDAVRTTHGKSCLTSISMPAMRGLSVAQAGELLAALKVTIEWAKHDSNPQAANAGTATHPGATP